jgi:hypothetical protein
MKTLGYLASVMLGLMIGAAPAVAAVEQCRFIQAKPEREACYQRQAIALAAKRKPEPTADTRTLETLQQMRRDDDEVYKSPAQHLQGLLSFFYRPRLTMRRSCRSTPRTHPEFHP